MEFEGRKGSEAFYGKSDRERGGIQGRRERDYAQAGEGSVESPSRVEIVWRR